MGERRKTIASPAAERRALPGVIAQLRVGELGRTESGEEPLLRSHPAPAEGETPSGLPARRQRYIDDKTEPQLRIMGETPMPRGGRRRLILIFMSALSALSAVSSSPRETEALLPGRKKA